MQTAKLNLLYKIETRLHGSIKSTMSDCSFTADMPTKYKTISNQLQQPTPHKLIAFGIMGPLVQGYCSASRSGEAIPHMLNRCERFNV